MISRQLRNEILLGVFFIVAIALLFALFHILSGTRSAREIRVGARFESAAGLVVDNDVLVAGVPVGRVAAISVEFDRARVELAIKADTGLRKDVVAKIRPKSLLGEKVVELVPHSPNAAPLQDGDMLAQTESSVELDEVFASLKPLFARLGPMAPEIEKTLHDLDLLLVNLNEVGTNKKSTLESIIDRTDLLLTQTNALLAANAKPLNATLTQSERLLTTLNSRAPALLTRAENTLAKIDTVAQAVPLDTLKRVPQGYDKIDRILDNLVPLSERMNRNGARIDALLINLDTILKRLAQIDELALRRFLQEEGVNVNLTQDAASKARIRALSNTAAQP